MTTPSSEIPETQTPVVYVRRVEVAALPEPIQAEVGGLDQVYAVHRTDGSQVALVKDRDLAFVLARQNDFQPVSVH